MTSDYRKRTVKVLFLVLSLLAASFSFPAITQAANVWALHTEGNKALESHQYELAVKKFEQVIPTFLQTKEYANAALVYGKIGFSYAELANYDKAEENWMLEASMWGKLAGKEQEVIGAERKAQFIKSDIRLFAEFPSTQDASHYHHVKYEPVSGVYLGAYAENDPAAHNAYDRNKFYMDKFPEIVGKQHAAYMFYLNYGMEVGSYGSHLAKAKELGRIVQIALQPMDGLDAVKDDAYLRKLARDMKAAEVPIFLRFANEMNESSAPWYGDSKKYIEKFRLVANIIHKEAPNVVMVWAPNWFPMNTIEQYYPGDGYVDWVGISLYKIHSPELDPLKKGVDRESYVEKLEHLYKLYGDRKPIYITEGGVSYTHIRTGADVTAWSAKQIQQFYAYLPLLYPGVKGFFWFSANDIRPELNIARSFAVSQNQTVLKAYKTAINQPYYLSNLGDESPVYYGSIAERGLPDNAARLHAYVKTADPNVAKVDFQINGKAAGSSRQAPWTINYNFSQHKGKEITIKVSAYNDSNQLLSSKSFDVFVGEPKALDSTFTNVIVTGPGQSVEVTIPVFDIKVNGTSIDNQNSKYPLLAYKGVTYFPMTWHYSEALGLKVKWDAQKGFQISSNPVSSSVAEVIYERGTKNQLDQTYKAVIPDFDIFVNDAFINNSQEQYPIITFRDVTYFPMTWQYAVEQFGLKTKWDTKTGFEVSTSVK